VRAVASILSIALFLAFATSGLQKLIYNTMASQVADHLGFSKAALRRIGLLESLGALAVLVGLAAHKGATLAWLNIAGAVGLVALMVGAVVLHLRKGDGFKGSMPALALGVVCVVEVVLRLA
jgi:DoxX-like family